MTRRDVAFPSSDGTCAGWVFDPAGSDDAAARPIIVLGHGLGGVKEMRLDAFAERFAAAGYRCLAFDYRHFGASTGEPRQLLDIGRQRDDWAAAVAYARSLDSVDADRVVLWGSSFGGGLVIDAAARDSRIAAVISQCPFTDGIASARATDLRSTVKVVARAVRDVAGSLVGRPPVMVDLAGPPGSAALMTAPDCEPGYRAVAEHAPAFRNEVAARFGLAIARYLPGRRVRKLRCPIMFGICVTDTVAPAAATRRHAKTAARAEISEFPCGHFDVYLGAPFERAVTDYVDFLRRHVPPDA
ncbi:alpha/beta hydrolase [Mycolicibacterium sediminis]|uniref:Alpha/beta hydrolase n=1 Tax=Mycolicibacterium sediminis TaxID=1286180 RepID=A0A7I7QYT4_9MYCO|nr:alpha/beta fold hydrolase [Mycolicibacterium sediminis]BBY31488.1 alpha/beta hydrolase [Mycolicibacterium sediminis]